MKSKVLILFVTVLGFAYGCKDNSGSSGTPEPNQSMSGTVDGKSWTANQVSAAYINNVLVVTGVASDGSQVVIRLGISEGFEVHKYSLTYNSSSDVVTFQETKGGVAWTTNQFDGSNAIPGEVDLTKFDKSGKKVSGTCVTDVKKIIDNSERSLNITFTNVGYSTDLGTTPDKTMTCKVDGKSWTASNVTAVKTGFTKSISIVGNATDQTTVSVTVPDDAKPGTFTIGTLPGLSDYLCQFNPSPTGFMTGYPGKVTITEHDDVKQYLKGTFSFTATNSSDTVEITSGVFETTY